MTFNAASPSVTHHPGAMPSSIFVSRRRELYPEEETVASSLSTSTISPNYTARESDGWERVRDAWSRREPGP